MTAPAIIRSHRMRDEVWRCRLEKDGLAVAEARWTTATVDRGCTCHLPSPSMARSTMSVFFAKIAAQLVDFQSSGGSLRVDPENRPAAAPDRTWVCTAIVWNMFSWNEETDQ